MSDWCKCKEPDFPGFYDRDCLGPNPPCRKCKKKRNPYLKRLEPPFSATISFSMTINCGEKLREKIFKAHELSGGSNIALSETIEFILNVGADSLIRKLDKKEKKKLDKT